ncbi:MAG: 3-deoxy-D-manno-octulosonic acid transferase [Nitrospinales bacterium]
MKTLYHIIIASALIAASPYLLLRSAIDSAFRENMKHWLDNWKKVPFLSNCIWIHASSVGEVRIAKTLIGQLRETIGEDHPIILSTFTLTGFQLANEQEICKVFRMPPDLAFFIRPLLEKLDPSLLVLIEAELWPSLLYLCKERNVPVLVLNGRISRKSFRHYKLLRPLFDWISGAVTKFAVRSQVDADFLNQLKLPQEKVVVTGNMKFDAVTIAVGGVHPARDVSSFVIFASTRPGDEKAILQTIIKLKKDIPDSQFALAPRHLHRLEEVQSLIAKFNLSFELHSLLNQESSNHNPDIILIDEMGVLDEYYRQACIAYVGGGLNSKFGGQNILEPALYSIPVIFGKHMNNFRDEARLLVESGGGIQIDNPDELYPSLLNLLSNRQEAKERGYSAIDVIRINRGASKINSDLIVNTLNTPGDLPSNS